MAMKIVRLEVENVKRIAAVEIDPDDHAIVIGGENDQGKSTALDCIDYALAGGKALPAEPLRRGAKKGFAAVTLSGDEARGIPAMTARRSFTRGRDTLKLTTAKGKDVSSPQTVLDGLYSRAFDPEEFSRQSPKEQIETVKALVGLDFTEADRNRKALFDERTEINRQVKALQAQLDAAAIYSAPAEEVSVAKLSTELERRMTHNAANTRVLDKDAEITKEHGRAHADVKEIKRRLALIENSLEVAEQNADRKDAAMVSIQEEVEALVDEDVDAIREQITTAEETNRQVRANQATRELDDAYKVKAAASDSLTEHIDDIDADKARQIAEADFPVPGMSFDENGVTLDGLPLEQASSSDGIRVSTEMGYSLNPILPLVLIRNGALLDSKRFAAVLEIAEKHDGQVWIERVGDGGECTVIIEDGRVRADTPEPDPAA